MIRLTTVTGRDILPFLPDAARLRLSVFREFPYLYAGSMESEMAYLRTYSESPGSLFVVARAGSHVAGIATAIPMASETPEVQQPFREAAIPVAEIFYFGESVLEPAFRGQGTGVRFMEEREAWARRQPGIRFAAFCAVERPPGHPQRPPDYVPLDAFWQHRGFTKTSLQTEFTWRETGEPEPTSKRMTFWMKPLT